MILSLTCVAFLTLFDTLSLGLLIAGYTNSNKIKNILLLT